MLIIVTKIHSAGEIKQFFGRGYFGARQSPAALTNLFFTCSPRRLLAPLSLPIEPLTC